MAFYEKGQVRIYYEQYGNRLDRDDDYRYDRNRSVWNKHRDKITTAGGAVGGAILGGLIGGKKGAVIGNRCKISSHTFVCEGVTIEDEVFVGHGVMFINDPRPRATAAGRPQTEADWCVVPTRVSRGASIGSGAAILCGITIGVGALVGAGAVVTRDVPPGATVAGVPARLLRPHNGGLDRA